MPISRSCAPLSSADANQRPGSDAEAQPQPWDHDPLLPARVILREFVAWCLTVAGESTAVGEDVLWRFILDEIPDPLRPFGPVLQAEWLHKGDLLLLDGLDEVSEAARRREQVKAAVERFVAVFPRVRVLVTSLTYAYQRQDWKLNSFREAVLAPFDEAQIRQFVERRSLWASYPYPTARAERAQREDLKADRHQSRVLRGGAFNFGHWCVRCAVRNWGYPYGRDFSFGFRVGVVRAL